MVPVCDKRYHIYNRFRHFWADIKKLWNYLLLSPHLVTCKCFLCQHVKELFQIQLNILYCILCID